MVGNIIIIGEENKQGAELKATLKKDTAFSVLQVPKNSQALSTLLEKEADLVILNPKASHQEIIDLYYNIRKEEAARDIPVILLMDENEMRAADLPSGIQDVLIRPLRFPESVFRINFLFKKIHKIDQKNLIQRGRLTIDVIKYETRVGDRKIDLTFTELELLKFLASNPGTVFTREVLLNKVWGYEYYGGTRTVDVHIRRLRSKIEGKTDNFIETVRNIGYKFIYEE